MISGFRREGDENCALLVHYAACSGNSLPKFRDNLSDPSWPPINVEPAFKCNWHLIYMTCTRAYLFAVTIVVIRTAWKQALLIRIEWRVVWPIF